MKDLQSAQFSAHTGYTPEEIEEIEWERGAVTRGIARYRSSLYSVNDDGTTEMRDLGDLEPGVQMLRELVSNVEPAVINAVAEAKQKLSDHKSGRWENWWFPLLSLEPKAWVIVAGKAVLAQSGQNGQFSRSVRSIALEIGRNGKLEVEFREWKRSQNEKARTTGAPNWWKLMQSRSPEIDERAFKKFKAKSKELDKVEWSREMRLAIGTKLLTILVEHGGGWFQFALKRKPDGRGFFKENVIELTPLAQSWIKGRHRGNELSRPWLVPMLTEPKPWTREVRPDKEMLHEPSED
jgi:hypothetical protein